MFDFSNLLEFSRTHCVAICAVMVPVNLLLTLRTLILVGLNRPVAQVWQATGWASLAAIVLVLHVMSWLVIGVVMVPTYVLLTLGSVCLMTNLWAVQHPHSLRWIFKQLGRSLKGLQTRATISS